MSRAGQAVVETLRRVKDQPRVAHQVWRLREFRNRVVDQELRQLESLRRGLRRGQVDVLLLGDSSCLFGSPGDAEAAMIPELLGRRLDARVAHLSGAGYSALLHTEVLRLLGTLDERPAAVVSSVCVRTSTSTHVIEHPVYSYAHSLETMRHLRSARHHVRALGRGRAPTPGEYEAWKALPVSTRWSGETTIGAFRERLQGLGARPWPAEQEALLFDYFHGQLLSAGDPVLERWRDFGRQVREYGVRAVSYQTAIPVERGEVHYPGEFAELAKHKRTLVDDAVRDTAGADYVILDPGMTDADFGDSRDGTEHFSFSGRAKVVEAVAGALGH